jgi:hypothetical protein
MDRFSIASRAIACSFRTDPTQKTTMEFATGARMTTKPFIEFPLTPLLAPSVRKRPSVSALFRHNAAAMTGRYNPTSAKRARVIKVCLKRLEKAISAMTKRASSPKEATIMARRVCRAKNGLRAACTKG